MRIELNAQALHDKNWFVTTPWYDNPVYGTTRFTFDTSSFQASCINPSIGNLSFTCAVWSDADGNFKCISNGCHVLNANFDTMSYGYSTNPGIIHPDYCDEMVSYPAEQSALFLGFPGDSLVYLFHLKFKEIDFDPEVVGLNYTTVNLAGYGGKGSIVSLNKTLIKDTLAFGQLTAVRHANGTDWWLVMHKNNSNTYYTVLLTPTGPMAPIKQNIGAITEKRDGRGSAVFSPDGRFYVRADGFNGIEVLEFDRCRGRFFNPRGIPTVVHPGLFHGVAISPNSRYLYLSTWAYLEQLDLYASELDASRDTVAAYDSFLPESPRFHMMQLAPNGKIYITKGYHDKDLTYIDKPDLPGIACSPKHIQFVYDSMPCLYSSSPPHFPNFRLGAASPGYCDSLLLGVRIVEPGRHMKLSIQPNPALSETWLLFDEPVCGDLGLFDALGQQLLWREIGEETTRFRLDLRDWKAGVYLLSFEGENGRRARTKLIIVK